MEDKDNIKWGIDIRRIRDGWSFGSCLTFDKYTKEFYLYINLLVWTISIGRLWFYSKEDYEE